MSASSSGYMWVGSGIERGYPFLKTVRSLAAVCDEVIAVVPSSSDGTREALVELAEQKLRIVDVPWPKSKTFDGELKQLGREACSGRVLVQMDADEEFHPHSVPQARIVCRGEWDTPCLGSIQFDMWGPDRGSFGVKWRFTKNEPWIRHDCGSIVGSDGCFMIDSRSNSVLPFTVPAWGVVGFWPLVIHSGGADMAGKLKRSRDFWADRWDELRGGWSLESTALGEARGKTDEQLRGMAAELLTRSHQIDGRGIVEFPREMA